MSDDQLTQLSKSIQAMGDKFDGQFLTLFQYMERRFKTIEDRLDQCVTRAEFNVFMDAVDAFAKRMEIYDHERLALGHKVDRHERWHHQTAKAVGLNLKA